MSDSFHPIGSSTEGVAKDSVAQHGVAGNGGGRSDSETGGDAISVGAT